MQVYGKVPRALDLASFSNSIEQIIC